MKDTAFVIIHGIGQQVKYETLDSFVQGFIREFSQKPGVHYSIQHKIEVIGKSKKKALTKNFIRIAFQQPVVQNIDIYEYYWANLTENKATMSDIDAWIKKTLAGTKNYWAENQKLQSDFEKRGADAKPYWGKMGTILKQGLWIYRAMSLVKLLIPNVGWLKSVINGLSNTAAALMMDFVGDIAIYTTMDAKSKNHLIRKQILKGSTELVETLMDDEKYGKIITCGHSLGSVIAFDTLNKINLKANVNLKIKEQLHKLKGLVTFGSPLDKIAFFFREKSGSEQYVRKQILANLHSFKTKKWNTYEENTPQIPGPERFLEQLTWLNFYHDADPVSGHLDFYKVEKNIERTFKDPKANRWGFSHTGYWEDEPMYSEIAAIFLHEFQHIK